LAQAPQRLVAYAAHAIRQDISIPIESEIGMTKLLAPCVFLCIAFVEGTVRGAKGVENGSDNYSSSSCVRRTLTGLDMLLGVCGAQRDIKRCASNKHPARACRKVKGPGGNLITQDITEDVILGSDTPKHTSAWHKAFGSCAEGSKGNCLQATSLYKPVLDSVQHGLMELLGSSSCQQEDQLKGLVLTEDDFVDCGTGGDPQTTTKLVAVADRLRERLPNDLAKFPLHGVVAWALPQVELPPEADDE